MSSDPDLAAKITALMLGTNNRLNESLIDVRDRCPSGFLSNLGTIGFSEATGFAGHPVSRCHEIPPTGFSVARLRGSRACEVGREHASSRTVPESACPLASPGSKDSDRGSAHRGTLSAVLRGRRRRSDGEGAFPTTATKLEAMTEKSLRRRSTPAIRHHRRRSLQFHLGHSRSPLGLSAAAKSRRPPYQSWEVYPNRSPDCDRILEAKRHERCSMGGRDLTRASHQRLDRRAARRGSDTPRNTGCEPVAGSHSRAARNRDSRRSRARGSRRKPRQGPRYRPWETPEPFNPTHIAWLPILHTRRGARHYTALYSNTARAHELGATNDWVVIYRDDHRGGGQWTVVTAQHGARRGQRIVMGRDEENAPKLRRSTG